MNICLINILVNIFIYMYISPCTGMLQGIDLYVDRRLKRKAEWQTSQAKTKWLHSPHIFLTTKNAVIQALPTQNTVCCGANG